LTEEIALGTEEKEDAEGESKEGIEGIEGQERGSGFARAGTEITFEGDSGMSGGINLDADDDGGDDLTFEAIELVRRTGKASASLLQRHLKIGYARAARLLDILEEKGVVGPVDGAKPRKVYMEGVL